MKRNALRVFCIIMLLITQLLNPLICFADRGRDASGDFSLDIATTDSRPLSNDRLLYAAFKDIGYITTFSTMPVEAGYELANTGEKDGVVAATPDIQLKYADLRKVSIPLEQIYLSIFERENSGFEFKNWSSLSGYKIGIITQRPFIISNIPDDANIIEKDSVEALMGGLLAGEYDAVIHSYSAHETFRLPDGVVRGAELGELEDYLYLNKKFEHLIPGIENSLAEMFEDGRAGRVLNDIQLSGIEQRKTVLHLISTNIQVGREEQFSTKLKEPFDDDLSVEWYTVELNSRRLSRDQGRLGYYASLLRQDCLYRDIGAIVVSGDNALDFLKSYYYLFFRNVPVLYYGIVNDVQEAERGFEPFFTGIQEHLSAYDTVTEALSFFPNTKSIFVVNDYTSEGRYYSKEISRQLEPFVGSLKIEHNANTSCDALIERIKGLPDDALVFVGSYFCDSDGQYYPLPEMKKLLEKDCQNPIFAIHSTAVEYGSLGGKMLDYEKFGELTSDMLKTVLNGGSIGSMPAVTDSENYNRWVFDKLVMDKFSVKESELPEGSQVINRRLSIWETDPFFAVALIALLILGISTVATISTFLIRYRKQKEKAISDAKIKEVKERLERIINTAPLAFMLTVDGVVVEANEYIKRNLGIVIGGESNHIYTKPNKREELIARVKSFGLVENQVVSCNTSSNDNRRFLANVTGVEYEGKQGFIFWAMDIEDREMQKDELHATQNSLQTILDTLPLPVAITDGNSFEILYGNNVYSKMLGYDTPDSIYRQLASDALAEVQGDGVGAVELMKIISKAKGTFSKEVQFKSIANEIIDVRLYAVPIEYTGRKAIVGIMSDLAREKESERARRSLQTILDMLPMPIRIMNIDDEAISYVNNAALALFGINKIDEISNVSFGGLIPQVLADFTETNNVKMNHKIITNEVKARKVNGEEFDVRVTSCLIEYNGRAASLDLLQDLTAEKEFQRMLRDTAEKEKEANQLKGLFLVNMSHEIRTPMNAIIGLTEIELRKNPSRETKEIYTKINLSAKNLLEIINDILDLSKIEADKIELYDDEFTLEDVLNSAILVASPRLDGKNVEFMLNAALDLPRFIVGDRTRLWQILKNFLDNSAKYTDRGKIILDVYIDEERSNTEIVRLTFVISDTGIGMDDEQIERLFQPYEQVRNDAQKKYSGTGLGLAISKQLCELMGGDLLIESALGKGTTMTVSIPFKRSTNAENEMYLLDAQSLDGIKILAVDDDEMSLDIISKIVRNSKANCISAKSGMEAMDIILEKRDRGESFDIILLDYMMDGLTGLETARQIHLALSKAPKLLMVTSYQKLLLKQDLEDNGIDDIIEKPFIPSQFIHKLCATLGQEDETFEEENALTRFKDVKVLLCEDYKLNQEVALGMLAQFGIDADIAENGKEAIDILNSGNSYDLVLMDIQMPVMNGYEAARILRADKRFDSLPIISLTADAMKESVDKCMECGMNDHIAKPIEFENLQRVFMKWLPESKRSIEDTGLTTMAVDATNAALARFGGNRKLFEKALVDFSRMLPVVWPAFEVAIKEGEDLEREVHLLKGVAGNLGENEIYNCATEFELSMRRGKPDKELYVLLMKACEESKARISELAKKNDGASGDVGTAEELTSLLEMLKDALENYDPIASAETAGALKEKSWPGADEEKLKNLYDFSRKYRFDDALKILNSIMDYREGD